MNTKISRKIITTTPQKPHTILNLSKIRKLRIQKIPDLPDITVLISNGYHISEHPQFKQISNLRFKIRSVLEEYYKECDLRGLDPTSDLTTEYVARIKKYIIITLLSNQIPISTLFYSPAFSQPKIMIYTKRRYRKKGCASLLTSIASKMPAISHKRKIKVYTIEAQNILKNNGLPKASIKW
jgi:hypothetical protein